MSAPAKSPQFWALVKPTADRAMSASSQSTSPAVSGLALMTSATSPATCGAAMLVPDITPYPVPGRHDVTLTPGAAMSGLSRLLPSRVTGPRLLDEAATSLPSTDPTVNAAS